MVRLRVYNMLGQPVRDLVDRAQLPGAYAVEWNGLDAAGRPAASGVYLCRLETGRGVQVRRMLLAR